MLGLPLPGVVPGLGGAHAADVAGHHEVRGNGLDHADAGIAPLVDQHLGAGDSMDLVDHRDPLFHRTGGPGAKVSVDPGIVQGRSFPIAFLKEDAGFPAQMGGIDAAAGLGTHPLDPPCLRPSQFLGHLQPIGAPEGINVHLVGNLPEVVHQALQVLGHPGADLFDDLVEFIVGIAAAHDLLGPAVKPHALALFLIPADAADQRRNAHDPHPGGVGLAHFFLHLAVFLGLGAVKLVAPGEASTQAHPADSCLRHRRIVHASAADSNNLRIHRDTSLPQTSPRLVLRQRIGQNFPFSFPARAWGQFRQEEGQIPL